ncbi:MAG TPA: HupE/UreJ family protein [Pseudomonadales bacterium]|nr:HupE/UreJ family protein [Pseudomonadales bacterium]
MKWLLLGAVLSILLSAPGATAHEVRPGYLELVAADDGTVDVTWKLPILDGRMLALSPVLPTHCVADGVHAPEVVVLADARVERTRWSCGEAGLGAGRVAIEGLALTLIDVLVRIERPAEEPLTVLLKPDEPAVDLAAGRPAAAAVLAYLGLGIEHILLGVDHLAFVLGLLVLVRGRWLLVKTITAFTVAHSITLCAATFGWVRVSAGPVETVIALSILLLAVEIVHRQQGRDVLTARIPWVVAFGFGLLHGFGFAGALASVGLPQDAIPLALLLFNVGVEIGQLAFVAATLGALLLLRDRLPWPHAGPIFAAYLIGVPAAYWSIERFAGILSGV